MHLCVTLKAAYRCVRVSVCNVKCSIQVCVSACNVKGSLQVCACVMLKAAYRCMCV